MNNTLNNIREIFLVLLLIVLTNSLCVSQTTEDLFSLPGLRFGIDVTDDISFVSDNSLFYSRDTLFDGQKYLIYLHHVGLTYYIKIDGDKVYEATFYLDDEMPLMFDFGMEIGDTIDYNALLSATYFRKLVVLDKSIIQLQDGRDRIKIELDILESVHKETWIQGIGIQRSGPILHYNSFTDLKCVSAADGDIYLSNNFTSEDCDKRACLALSAYFRIEDSDENKVYLIDLTENIDEIEMHMGDGTVFNEFVTEYEYQERGCYDIEVIVRNSCGEEMYWHNYFDYCEDPKWYKKGNSAFTQMSFLSSDDGLAIVEDSIFKTVDGGENWAFKTRLDDQINGNYNRQSLFFKNEDLAIATLFNFQSSDKIYLSTNGGENWRSIYDGPHIIEDATIFDQDIIIATSNKEMIRSTDYGETWSIVEREEITWTYQLTNFVGNKIATVDSYFNGNAIQYILQISNDLGFTWSTIPFDDPIFSIYFLNDNVAYLGGYNTIYKTEDGGTSWVEVKTTKGSESFKNISFSDEDNGIVTSNHQIYVTEDGGQSWELEYCKNFFFLQNVQAFPESSIVQIGKSLYVRMPNPDFDCNTIISTTNQNKLDVEIAPNPTADNFHLMGNTNGNYQVEIRGIKGAIQKSIDVFNEESIDISDLSMGLYLISIHKDGLRQTFKLVKN